MSNKKDKLKEISKILIIPIIVNFAVSIIVSSILSWIVPLIINYIKWSSIIIIPVTGILFYIIRCRFRFLYGLTEFFVGMFTAIKVFIPLLNFNNINTTIDTSLKVLGGIYIIIRGMDNIEKSMENSKKIIKWKRFFYGKHTVALTKKSYLITENDSKFLKAKEIISEQINIPIIFLTLDTSFFDLNADSLDIVEIMLKIEEDYNIELSYDGVETINTIGDFFEHIAKSLN